VKKTKEYRSIHKDQKWNDFLQLLIDAAEKDKEGTDDKKDNSAKNNLIKTSATGKYHQFAKTALVLGVTQCSL